MQWESPVSAATSLFTPALLLPALGKWDSRTHGGLCIMYSVLTIVDGNFITGKFPSLQTTPAILLKPSEHFAESGSLNVTFS